ncbi:MAG: cohesin domain-containing protein [Patescibacteria group bacterium]|nr:cohesin domain-containing protein [Patescibacteria group bacterium]
MQNANAQNQVVQPGESQSTQAPTNNVSPDTKKLLKIVAGLTIILVAVGGYLAYQQTKLKNQQANQEVSEKKNLDNKKTGLADVDIASDGSETLPVGSKEALPPIEEEEQQASSNANLSITSSKASYQVGETFTAEVKLASAVVPEGVEFVLNYDPQLLSNVALEKGTVFSTYLKTNVYPDKGKIKVVIIKNPGENITLQPSTTLVTISGQTAQAGSLALSLEESEAIVAVAGGKNVLQGTKGLTVKVN